MILHNCIAGHGLSCLLPDPVRPGPARPGSASVLPAREDLMMTAATATGRPGGRADLAAVDVRSAPVKICRCDRRRPVVTWSDRNGRWRRAAAVPGVTSAGERNDRDLPDKSLSYRLIDVRSSASPDVAISASSRWTTIHTRIQLLLLTLSSLPCSSSHPHCWRHENRISQSSQQKMDARPTNSDYAVIMTSS